MYQFHLTSKSIHLNVSFFGGGSDLNCTPEANLAMENGPFEDDKFSLPC